MPPKKKGKKKDETPQIVFQASEESLGHELDLLNDLNDDFFASANKIIQMLMEASRNFEASKIKKYVDIIYILHEKYAEEVKENGVLRPKVIQAEQKLRLALELTATSEEAVEELRAYIEAAWRETDAAQLREQDIQEKLQEILIKCEAFERKEGETQDDTAEFGHLAKYKNIILRERDRLNGEVMDLEKRLQMQRYYCEGLEYINKNNDDSISKMTSRMRILDTEKQNLQVKIRQLQSTLEEQKEISQKTTQRLEQTSKELNDTQVTLEHKVSECDRLKYINEKFRSESVVHLRQISKNEDEIATLKADAKRDEDIIRKLRMEDKAKANTINQLNKKFKKAAQDLSMISSRLYKMNRTNNILNEEIVRLKNQMNALDKDLLNSAQKYEELRRLKENIQRERDALRSDIVKLNNQIADLRHTIMMLNVTIDGLRLDINKLNVKLDEAKINIAKSQKERDEMAQEVETLHDKIEYFQEQLNLKTSQIADLSEKLQQKISQLFNVKKQLESVHSEKMVLQRSLETCTQERDNYRVLNGKTQYQIAQLTSEIADNQNQINLLKLRIERLNNEKKEVQTELRSTQNTLASVRTDLKDLKTKNDGLMKIISEDEKKFMKISQELDETRKEKNLIGLQMVRRNDEIILLKEKFCIMQTALDQGQTQYNQRVEDIRLLKTEITNLRTERDCLSRAIKSTADMREEVIRLQRSLNQERIKVRALTEDAKTPTGVHRWRILKGEDPSRYELVRKVQMLQRRNLKQEIVKTNMEKKLEESQSVADSLKRVVENIPTTDHKRRVVLLQRQKRDLEKKLKLCTAEKFLETMESKVLTCLVEDLKRLLREQNQRVIKEKLASCKEMKKSVPGEKYYDLTCVTPSTEQLMPISNNYCRLSMDVNRLLGGGDEVIINNGHQYVMKSQIRMTSEETQIISIMTQTDFDESPISQESMEMDSRSTVSRSDEESMTTSVIN